jgi:hypothetical protein
MILVIRNLLPRLAWEPIDEKSGPKMRFTFNGQPLRRRG